MFVYHRVVTSSTLVDLFRDGGFSPKRLRIAILSLFLVSVARLELARLATMDSKSILSTIPTHRQVLYDATGDARRIF